MSPVPELRREVKDPQWPVPARGDELQIDMRGHGLVDGVWVVVESVTMGHSLDGFWWTAKCRHPASQYEVTVGRDGGVISGWRPGPESLYQPHPRYLTDPHDPAFMLDAFADLCTALGTGKENFGGRVLGLIDKADASNLERLRLGFPRLVAAWEFWREHAPVPADLMYAHLDMVADVRPRGVS